ncbi:uncharacterized protein AAGF69_002477 [Amazona ochrocephala]
MREQQVPGGHGDKWDLTDAMPCLVEKVLIGPQLFRGAARFFSQMSQRVEVDTKVHKDVPDSWAIWRTSYMWVSLCLRILGLDCDIQGSSPKSS